MKKSLKGVNLKTFEEYNWLRELRGIRSIQRSAMDAMKNIVAIVQDVSLKRGVKNILGGLQLKGSLRCPPLFPNHRSLK